MTWALIVNECSGCTSFPCVCPGPVSAACACGGVLTAVDTLEDKGRAHRVHFETDRHQVYLDLSRERPTATVTPVTCPVGPRASAATVRGPA